MVLEGLAVGEADGAVEGVLARKLVDAQPLFGLDDAAGQAAAQHHAFQRFKFLCAALVADVAVVLLVHAVETDELEVVALETAGDAIGEVAADSAVQVVALVFEAFVVGEFAGHDGFPLFVGWVLTHHDEIYGVCGGASPTLRYKKPQARWYSMRIW